jgi:hypothetical protein
MAREQRFATRVVNYFGSDDGLRQGKRLQWLAGSAGGGGYIGLNLWGGD